MSAVRQHVEMMGNLVGRTGVRHSPYALLREHGVEYTWTGWRLPRGVRRGKLGLCFMNAFRLATAQPDKYRYVEGIATHIIPTEHAWCVTADGTVVDPTWRRFERAGETAPEYLGVPIRLDYAMKVMCKTRVYGVLWNYIGAFPMLTANPTEWRAP